MWVTKRRTKQENIVYKKRVVASSIVGSGILVLLGVVCYGLFMYFIPRPLLLPIPPQAKAASPNVQVDTTQTLTRKLAEIGISDADIKKQADGDLIVSLKDNGQIIISQSRNLSAQIASLQVILQRLTMEGKRFSKLDLRFDKPVITTN